MIEPKLFAQVSAQLLQENTNNTDGTKSISFDYDQSDPGTPIVIKQLQENIVDKDNGGKENNCKARESVDKIVYDENKKKREAGTTVDDNIKPSGGCAPGCTLL